MILDFGKSKSKPPLRVPLSPLQQCFMFYFKLSEFISRPAAELQITM